MGMSLKIIHVSYKASAGKKQDLPVKCTTDLIRRGHKNVHIVVSFNEHAKF